MPHKHHNRASYSIWDSSTRRMPPKENNEQQQNLKNNDNNMILHKASKNSPVNLKKNYLTVTNLFTTEV